MSILALACLLLSAAAAIAQGRTWIVDQNNGPGTHFTDIPPAVAAAADGDTILVRTGTYTPFVTGKALTVLGDGSVVVDSGFPPGPGYTVRITGLAPGKTFVMKNVAITMQTFLTGLVIDANQGRVHLEDVSATLLGNPSRLGIACRVNQCTLVTITGGTLSGRPALSANAATLSLAGVTAIGQGAWYGSLGASIEPSPALQLSNVSAHLSRTSAQGGSGTVHALFTKLPQPAVVASASALVVTGDASTAIAAGRLAGGPATAAIQATGGTVDLDPTVAALGSQGGPDVGGTALVIRRRIVSLDAAGAPPGGTLRAEVVSPAGDALFLAAAAPTDPVALPIGTLFVDARLLLPLYVGAQVANEHLAVAVTVPGAPSLRGAAIGLQAANWYQSTQRTELSNAAVVLLH